MAIEKVFAIHASQEAIWEALWADLSEGDGGAYALEGSGWPSRLELQVNLGGVTCDLLYRIEQREGYCEVAAILAPISRRYPIYNLLTFGNLRRNYEMLLATGLANLKASVEGAGAPLDGDGADGRAGHDGATCL